MEIMAMNNFWEDRRVFITGATGLVGSWLVQSLINLRADIVVLVRDWVPKSLLLDKHTLSKITVVRGDLSCVNFIGRILAEYEIKTIVHLAAQTIVPIANKNPLSTFESNIAGTWNLLESCRLHQMIESIVIASSDKAYGNTSKLPYKEDMPLQAVYPYDVSKACADMLSVCYAKTWGLPIGITRCGNFFGGGDLNWSRIIPGTIRSIIRGQRPIIRSTGQLIRDYIYVEDAVSAYLTLAKSLVEQPEITGEAFNFSNSSQRTTLQLVEIILQLMNSSLQPLILNENHGEIKAQYLDISKANVFFGWEPKFSLEKGLKKTINWYQSFFEENEHVL